MWLIHVEVSQCGEDGFSFLYYIGRSNRRCETSRTKIGSIVYVWLLVLRTLDATPSEGHV